MTLRTLREARLPLVAAALPAAAAFDAVVWRGWHPLWLAAGLPLGFVLWFFRDPERKIPAAEGVLLAPADGVVRAVEARPANPPPGWPPDAAARVSVFLSVFDVHVNRSPCAGRVWSAEYRPGRFLDARDESSAFRNEAMTWRIRPAEGGGDVVVRQIAGAVARRIVAWKKPGDSLAAGERFGMIRFGSRTDLFLPEGWEACVRPGARARAGVTPLAVRKRGSPPEASGGA